MEAHLLFEPGNLPGSPFRQAHKALTGGAARNRGDVALDTHVAALKAFADQLKTGHDDIPVTFAECPIWQAPVAAS